MVLLPSRRATTLLPPGLTPPAAQPCRRPEPTRPSSSRAALGTVRRAGVPALGPGKEPVRPGGMLEEPGRRGGCIPAGPRFVLASRDEPPALPRAGRRWAIRARVRSLLPPPPVRTGPRKLCWR